MTAMVYIENEGALFRGISRGLPREVWSPKTRTWKRYELDGGFKPIEWGTVISEVEAKEMMAAP
jgi:hypothetical protein